MTEWINIYDSFAQRQIGKAYFGWLHWADEMNERLKNKKKRVLASYECGGLYLRFKNKKKLWDF